MLETLQECIDELCLKCGKYKNEHEGACKGCKWYEIKTYGYYHRKSKSASRFMLDLAQDLKFNCECEGECVHGSWTCPLFNGKYCKVYSPCEWII